MSAQVLLLNPRPKAARRRRVRSRHRRRSKRLRVSARRGRSYRRRVKRVAYAANPGHRKHRRRGRHYRYKANRRRRAHSYAHNPRRRRYRSNPIGLGKFFPSGRSVLDNYVIPGAIGGFGALTLDIAWGYAAPKLPAQVQTGWFALGAKLAVIVLAAAVVNKVMPRARNTTMRAAKGAAVVLGYGAVKQLAKSVLPASVPGLSGYIDYQSYSLPTARGVHGYMPRTLGGLGDDLYSPAAVIQPPGVPVPRQFGGYVAVQPNMLNGYQPHMTSGVGDYDWRNDGM